MGRMPCVYNHETCEGRIIESAPRMSRPPGGVGSLWREWERVVKRNRQAEIMDQPGLDKDRHFQALRGLARINGWSGTARLLWLPIRDLLRELGRPLRLLDVASGAGDMPIRLWRYAKRAGLPLEIDGADLSSDAVEYARRQAAEQGADVRFFQCDALAGTFDGYDIVVCSLFLHHLTEEQVVDVLRRMRGETTRQVLVHDLERGRLAWLLTFGGTRLFTTSDVVHTDGPRSVAAAFSRGELRGLADRAGLTGAVIARRWPFRLLLQWRRSG